MITQWFACPNLSHRVPREVIWRELAVNVVEQPIPVCAVCLVPMPSTGPPKVTAAVVRPLP